MSNSRWCSVNNCDKYTSSYFHFCTRPPASDIWLERCDNPDLGALSMGQLSNRAVCNKHFEAHCITEGGRLKRFAIPTLHLPFDVPQGGNNAFAYPTLTAASAQRFTKTIVGVPQGGENASTSTPQTEQGFKMPQKILDGMATMQGTTSKLSEEEPLIVKPPSKIYIVSGHKRLRPTVKELSEPPPQLTEEATPVISLNGLDSLQAGGNSKSENCNEDIFNLKFDDQEITVEKRPDFNVSVEQDTGRLFRCTKCSRKFTSRIDLNKHNRFRHPVSVTFERAEKRPNLNVSINQDAGGQYKCDVCCENFKSQHYLTKHKVEIHNSIERLYCEKCGVTFLSSRELKTHEVLHDTNGCLYCPKCDKRFTNSFDFDKHKKFAHPVPKVFERVDQMTVEKRTDLNVSVERERDLDTHEVQMAENFSCGKCDRTFSSLKVLGTHKLLHESFRCPDCDESFTSRIDLNKHKRSRHPVSETFERLEKRPNLNVSINQDAVGRYKCDVCCENFKSQHYLTKHKVEMHNVIERLYCEKCGVTFLSSRELKTHEALHDMNGCLYCPECDKRFMSTNDFNEHKKFGHPVPKVFERVEQKTVEKRPDLNVSVERERNLDTREIQMAGKFSRGKCDETFPSSEVLEATHELLHAMQNFLCSECGKNFFSITDLRNHRRSRHPVLKTFERYECDVCGKNFKSPQYLIKHKVEMHKAIWSLYCEKCGETFSSLKELETHKASHCPILDKSVMSTIDFNKHKEFGHPVPKIFERVELEERPDLNVSAERDGDLDTHEVQMAEKFSCGKCDGTFPSLEELEAHELLHAMQNFRCSECGKNFYSITDLRNHRRSRHPVPKTFERYKCDVCGKNFKSQHYLIKHTVEIHNAIWSLYCEKCGETFSSLKELETHKASHCPILDKSVMNTIDFNKHKKFGHPVELEERLDLNVSVERDGDLDKREVQTAGKFSCGKCDETFSSSKLFEIHKALHGMKAYFYCPKCDKRFVDRNDFETHKRIKHPALKTLQYFKKQMLECSKPYKTPPFPSEAKEHQLRHTSKPNDTSKRFQREKNPDNSAKLSLRNPPKGLTNFKVIKYSRGDKKTFPNSPQLGKDLTRPDEGTAFNCDQCGGNFKNKSSLGIHKIFSHSTEPLVQCEECLVVFATVQLFKQHVINVSEEKPYKCCHCCRSFESRASLTDHENLSHKEDVTFAGTSRVENISNLDDQNIEQSPMEFEKVDVKIEPFVVFDSEGREIVMELKSEIEDEMDVDVKQEPEEIDEFC